LQNSAFGAMGSDLRFECSPNVIYSPWRGDCPKKFWKIFHDKPDKLKKKKMIAQVQSILA
jgi:hypothetical protein